MRWTIAGLLVLASCGGRTASAPEVPDEALHIAGSVTLTQKLLPMLADTHQRAVGTIDIVIEGGGSSEGMRRLLAKEVDVAASSRPHRPAEQEQALADGYSLEDPDARHIIAVDVIALAVHPSNPVGSLTYDQVIAIFCTRSIDNWSFLGHVDAQVHPLNEPKGSGTRALFEDFFCGSDGIHRTIPELDLEALNAALTDDPYAIGFVSMSQAGGKVLGLRPDPRGPAVLPSQQNIIRGAYPLYRDLYLYTRGPATGDALAFMSWIGSPAGQEVVDEARFVPLFLRPERLDEPRPLRETIHFEPGESVPNQRSLARLALLVDELRDRAASNQHVILEGYTDTSERERVELSKARAQAVRELLAKELPGLYFEIIPRGAVNPIAPNETPYGRQRNRRVQVYLAAEEKPAQVEVTEGDG